MTAPKDIKCLVRLLAVASLLGLFSSLTGCSGGEWFPDSGPTTSFSSDFVNGGKPSVRKW